MATLSTVAVSDEARIELEEVINAETSAAAALREANKNQLAIARAAKQANREELEAKHALRKAAGNAASEITVCAILLDQQATETAIDLGFHREAWVAESSDDALLDDDDTRDEAFPLYVYSGEAIACQRRTLACATFYATPTKGIYGIVARAEVYNEETDTIQASPMLQPSDLDTLWKVNAIREACAKLPEMPLGFRWMISTTPYSGETERVKVNGREFKIPLTSCEALNVSFAGEVYESDVRESRTRCARKAGTVKTSPCLMREKPEEGWSVSQMALELSRAAKLADAIEAWWSKLLKRKPVPFKVSYLPLPRTFRHPQAYTSSDPVGEGFVDLRFARTLAGFPVFAGREEVKSSLFPWMSVREAARVKLTASFALACGIAADSSDLMQARREAEAKAESEHRAIISARRASGQRSVAKSMTDIMERVASLSYAA